MIDPNQDPSDIEVLWALLFVACCALSQTLVITWGPISILGQLCPPSDEDEVSV